jgi:Escherichia/Staphylococcus phage prohead protease
LDNREFSAEFKSFGDDAGPGSFEGLAAVFGNVDRQNERILPGAFASTLADFAWRGFLTNAHDWREPIGTIDSAEETGKGLLVRGTFHSTPTAQTVRQLVRERAERGKQIAMSIGYAVKSDEFQDGVRLLKELELHEVALVAVPANPLAHVMSLKAIETEEAEIEARRIEVRRIQLQRLAAERASLTGGIHGTLN